MKETSVTPMKFLIVSEGTLRIDRIGAGIGIIMYSREHKKASGVHVLKAKAPPNREVNPVLYADTVVPHALKEFEKEGVSPPFSIAVAGGASLMSMPPGGDMGRKILQAVKETLEKYGLKVKIEKTGGSEVRTIKLNVDAGKMEFE